MKLQDYSFSKESRKDISLVDFINDVTKIINFVRGLIQSRINNNILKIRYNPTKTIL